ncbi:MAG: hypothetical protein J2O46_01370, partial [Nocardioides sp.]|nr:hypothetical protein [Nocardioides sp.]
MLPRTVPRALRHLVTAATLLLLAATALGSAGGADLAPVAWDHQSTPHVSAQVGTQSPERLTITVTGRGFSGASPGLDVALTPTGYVSSASDDAYIAEVEISSRTISRAHGSISVTLTLDAAQVAELDSSRTYQILTVRSGDRDQSQTTRTPVTFDFTRLARHPQGPSSTQTSTPSSTAPSSAGSGSGSGTASGTRSSGSGTGAAAAGAASSEDASAPAKSPAPKP